MNVEEKRQLELKTMYQMIGIYCKHKHHSKSTLCDSCEDVWKYAEMRVHRCPHMETKTFCAMCKTHCYGPNYRDKVREIMRFSGPRMLLVSPWQVIKHIYYEWRERRKAK